MSQAELYVIIHDERYLDQIHHLFNKNHLYKQCEPQISQKKMKQYHFSILLLKYMYIK